MVYLGNRAILVLAIAYHAPVETPVLFGGNWRDLANLPVIWQCTTFSENAMMRAVSLGYGSYRSARNVLSWKDLSPHCIKGPSVCNTYS